MVRVTGCLCQETAGLKSGWCALFLYSADMSQVGVVPVFPIQSLVGLLHLPGFPFCTGKLRLLCEVIC